ncbi:hypothetical protein GCM10020229_65220 [Kitasatospora albolonga]
MRVPIAEEPEPRPAEDPFDNLVLDEEFVRSAEVKEQSGRTRMLTARWKEQPPHDPGGRRSVNDGPRPKRRFGRKPKPVDPWGNVRRSRPNWQAPLYVALAVALVLAALNVESLRGWYADWRGDTGTADGTAARPVPTVGPETAKPTAAAPQVDEQQPTVARPWAGSPAEGWPAGPDAILLPQAQAVGTFDADQVAARLKLVKDFLVASNLDHAMVAGGQTDTALSMLDTDPRRQTEGWLRAPSEKGDATSVFSRFDPRDAIPVNDTVKVQGRMSFEGDGEKGLLVRTDYTFVYALRPGPEAGKKRPSPAAGTVKPAGFTTEDVAPNTWTARTIVRRVMAFRFYDPARYDVDSKKIRFADTDSDVGNSACDVYDGFFHPQFAQFNMSFGTRPEPTGPSSDPYDRSKDIEKHEECGTTTRS